jgi:hypothetical protein
MVEHLASLLGFNVEAATTSVFAAISDLPGGVFWLFGIVVVVLLASSRSSGR